MSGILCFVMSNECCVSLGGLRRNGVNHRKRQRFQYVSSQKKSEGHVRNLKKIPTTNSTESIWALCGKPCSVPAGK